MFTDTLQAIVTTAREALDGLDVSVTDDPAAAASTVHARGVVVLVLAGPELEFETWHQVNATWTAWVIDGHTKSPRAAATRFEPLLTALAQPLGIDTARPQTYDLAGHSWPGYELTFTTSTL